MNPTSSDVSPAMKGTYIAVIVVEVIIILGLWALGRMFA